MDQQVTLTGPTTVDLGMIQQLINFIDKNSTEFLVALIITGLTIAVIWLARKAFKKNGDQDFLTREDFESFKEHHNARYREFKKENHDEHTELEKRMDSQFAKVMEKLGELAERIAELKGEFKGKTGG